MTKRHRWALWVILLLGVSACAGCLKNVPLTKQARASMRAVRISQTVKMPEDIAYVGPSHNVGLLLGGPLGALAADPGARPTKDRLKAAIGQIDLPKLLRDQLEVTLTAARVFPAVVQEGGDAEIVLDVRGYGFATPSGFSAEVRSQLTVRATMLRPDGAILWQRDAVATILNDKLPARPVDAFLQDLGLVREAFALASKIVTDDLVEHIRQE